MKRILILLLVADVLPVSAVFAEEEWINDTEIRDRFVEQILALKESSQPRGISAAELRRQLRREKHGVPGFDPAVPEPWEGSRSELYERTKRSTLIVGHIYSDDSGNNWRTNLAGGVIIAESGLAVTNFHVLEFEKAAIFAAMDEKGRLIPIQEVAASNRKDDLAILKLEPRGDFQPVPLAGTAEIGEPVFIVSHPDAHFFTFTTGSISRFSTNPGDEAHRLEVTAPFARGSSGSGIFNARGRLVGIASATNAIYYEEDDRDRRNLQMVIHSGVPIVSLRRLIEGD